MIDEKYATYLAGREWAVLKEQVKKRSRGRCERCCLNEGSAVHHKTYIRKYCELIEDLQHVCTPCHEFLSGKSDKDPCDAVFNSVLGVQRLFRNDKYANHVFGAQIKCPICGGENVHVGSKEAIKEDNAWEHRGNMLAIPCYCECSCNFYLCLGFYKGYSWMFIQKSDVQVDA